jgi:hypothetical protein
MDEMPAGWSETDILLPGGWLGGEPYCTVCRNTGVVVCTDDDGSGYAMACTACETAWAEHGISASAGDRDEQS